MSTIGGLGSPTPWIVAALAVLGLGCTSPATPPPGPAARILIGDADTFTVHSRLPLTVPARVVDQGGREVAGPPVDFTWLSGDSIPVSPAGAMMCHAPGTAVVGASTTGAFERVVIRCLPVRSVRMAGPVDLLLSDSSRRLQAQVLGLDGKPIRAFYGMTEILRPSVVRVDDGRMIPLAPGGTLLSLTVGDETSTIAVHVYEEVATLDGLRPEQDHVAVPVRLRRGESSDLTLPAGTWLIAMQPNLDLPDGLRFDVEGASCESMGWPKGRILCLSKSGGFIRISLQPTSKKAGLNTDLLLRRTRG